MSAWHKFTRSVINYPVCGVSRASIFTGRRQPNLGGYWTHGTPTDAATVGTGAYWDANVGGAHMFPRWLQRAGYFTACFGKYLNVFPWNRGDLYIPEGWNEWRVMLDDDLLGGTHAGHSVGLFSYSMNVNGVVNNFGTADTWTTTGADDSGRVGATDYSTDRISNMLTKVLTGGIPRPFYVHLGLYAVKQASTTVGPAARHAGIAYTPERPPSFAEADIADKPGWLRDHKPTVPSSAVQTGWDDEQRQKWRSTQAIDELIRDLVRDLTAMGALDSTFIIVTTENSNLLGQHRLDKKGVPYEPCVMSPMYVHVPTNTARANIVLIIVDDMVVDGWAKMAYLAGLPTVTNTALVSTIDLCPTFLEIGRATRHASRPVDGMSLMPLLTGAITAAQWRPAMISEWVNNNTITTAIPTWKTVRNDAWRYTEVAAIGANPAETELYDLTADPDELVNQTANAAHAATKADLAARLAVLSGTG